MSTPRRILHVLDCLEGYGTTAQLKLLVDHQIATGNAVQVVALSADRNVIKAWRKQGIDCRVLDRRWGIDPFSLGRLTKICWQSRFDLIHAWNQDAIDYLQLAKGSPEVPWIGTLMRSSTENWPERFRLRRPDALVSPFASKKAGHVISPAVPVHENAQEFRSEFLREQSLEEDAPIIAIAGKLTRANRIEEAIWAYELIRIIDDRARLLIFGDGPERARLERFARLASESNAIRFLGHRDDLARCLPLVDVFWFAGVGDGSISCSVLEAMAAGVPVVVTETPESQTLIEQGTNGFLVPMDHRALRTRYTLQLLENKALACQIAQAGTELVQREFAASKMIEAYEVLYKEVLTSSNAGTIEVVA